MKDIPNASLEVFNNIFGQQDTIIREVIDDVERFHNKHESFFLELDAQLYDKKWADLFSISLANVIYMMNTNMDFE